mmetsp:Transcript_29416/g.32708  ORF Transcript_29416/g.32708 Transcript_29416/m.32708 type:complete len:105 (+) Transcript_29416:1478-1792(+)
MTLPEYKTFCSQFSLKHAGLQPYDNIEPIQSGNCKGQYQLHYYFYTENGSEFYQKAPHRPLVCVYPPQDTILPPLHAPKDASALSWSIKAILKKQDNSKEYQTG